MDEVVREEIIYLTPKSAVPDTRLASLNMNNMPQFIKDFNKKSAEIKVPDFLVNTDFQVAVLLRLHGRGKKKDYSFEIKGIPTRYFILALLKEKEGKKFLSKSDVERIAFLVKSDHNTNRLEQVCKTVEGIAKSMSVVVKEGV